MPAVGEYSQFHLSNTPLEPAKVCHTGYACPKGNGQYLKVCGI